MVHGLSYYLLILSTWTLRSGQPYANVYKGHYRSDRLLYTELPLTLIKCCFWRNRGINYTPIAYNKSTPDFHQKTCTFSGWCKYWTPAWSAHHGPLRRELIGTETLAVVVEQLLHIFEIPLHTSGLACLALEDIKNSFVVFKVSGLCADVWRQGYDTRLYKRTKHK